MEMAKKSVHSVYSDSSLETDDKFPAL
jgi:hypothetical protein